MPETKIAVKLVYGMLQNVFITNINRMIMKLFSTRIQLSVFFFLISYSILSFFFFKRFHFHLFIFFSLLVFVSLEDRPNFYFWFFKISHKIEFHTFFQNRQMKIVSIHYFSFKCHHSAPDFDYKCKFLVGTSGIANAWFR